MSYYLFALCLEDENPIELLRRGLDLQAPFVIVDTTGQPFCASNNYFDFNPFLKEGVGEVALGEDPLSNLPIYTYLMRQHLENPNWDGPTNFSILYICPYCGKQTAIHGDFPISFFVSNQSFQDSIKETLPLVVECGNCGEKGLTSSYYFSPETRTLLGVRKFEDGENA